MEAHPGRRRISLSFYLLAAALAAYLLSQLLSIEDRAVLNVGFAMEVLLLSLIYRKQPLSWREINYAIGLFSVISIVAFVAGAFLIETSPDVARFLVSPINDLGYYPHGAHTPLVIGAPIWVLSIYLLCIGAFLLGRMLSSMFSNRKDAAETDR